MSPRVPTIDDDIIEAIREDDIESTVAEVRGRLETYNGFDSSLLT